MHKGRREIDWATLEISVKQLKSFADPTRTPPWDPFVYEERITLKQVMSAELIDYSYDSRIKKKSWYNKQTHYGRIRYLIENGWTDAISVEVGSANFGPFWIIGDGNHRLAASILKNDKYILCACDGDIKELKRRFVKHVNYEKVSYLQ